MKRFHWEELIKFVVGVRENLVQDKALPRLLLNIAFQFLPFLVVLFLSMLGQISEPESL